MTFTLSLSSHRRPYGTRSVTIDKRKCNACKLCTKACPQQVLGMVAFGPHRHVKLIRARAHDCTGCLKCVRACEQGAIAKVAASTARPATRSMAPATRSTVPAQTPSRSGIPRQASVRYPPIMLDGARLLRRQRIFGAVGITLAGVVHGLHDLGHGDSPAGAFLPMVPMALSAVLLSYGHKRAQERRWSFPTTIALALLVSLVCGGLTAALHLRWPSSFGRAAEATVLAGLGVLVFWIAVIYLPAQLMEARTRALEAESERRRAELARLRSNLHPHFLLNTLNAVAGLLTVEPQQARQLVIALGDLLRDSLEDEDAMRPLEHEAEWLRRYAEIFEIRHKDAIRFRWDLAPETLETPLPRLLLQPLLENAIEHGALQRQGGGTVTLRSRRVADAVEITVSDDGPGMNADRSSGLGLRLVENRLHLAYPKARMSIDTGEGGTSVKLDIPHLATHHDGSAAHYDGSPEHHDGSAAHVMADLGHAP